MATMMKLCLSLFVLFHSIIAVQCIGSHQNPENKVTAIQNNNCQIECLIDVVGFLYSEEETADNNEQSTTEYQGRDIFLCRLQNDAFQSRAGYRVMLPQDFVESNKGELSSASATICISSGEVDREDHRIVLADDAEISLLSIGRKLQSSAPIIGRRTILAVELTTAVMDREGITLMEEDPGMSKREIEGALFGTGPHAPGHDLISQYRDCSFGALGLEPASGANIENGVVEVRLRKPIAGGEILGSLQDEILDATEERVGSLEQFDHIIYCIPDNALMDGAESWTAFTYFHSHWSFFQKRRCSAMSVTIHELGHNLGFRHSGFNDEAYGDESGYMGFTIYQSGAPVKCFNAHKNYVAGWFRDRQYRVSPYMESPVLARLVTFVDYDKPLGQHDVVLIRVGPYFIQYNRAKGINIDTGMHKDQVSITYAPDAQSDSEAVVGLGDGEVARMPEYRSTGHDLVVAVCKIGSAYSDYSTVNVMREANFGNPIDSSVSSIDYAWVSIHLDNGLQQSRCNEISRPQITDQPSRRTRHPTAPPTARPSLRPTPLQSPKPSSQLTPQPTLPPSLPPTTKPTEKRATPQPTVTSTPNAAPTRKPTPVIGFSVQQLLQKRSNVEAMKDRSKLAKEDGEQVPAVRRRLKGGR